jgi:hypothetical protein
MCEPSPVLVVESITLTHLLFALFVILVARTVTDHDRSLKVTAEEAADVSISSLIEGT